MFLASVEEAKFRKPVVPGDQLRIEMTLEKSKQTVVKMKGAATVDGKLVAEAIVMCKLIERAPASPPGVTSSRAANGITLSSMAIHPTAIVDPKAEIASDAEIGPYCIIGALSKHRSAHALAGTCLS